MAKEKERGKANLEESFRILHEAAHRPKLLSPGDLMAGVAGALVLVAKLAGMELKDAITQFVVSWHQLPDAAVEAVKANFVCDRIEPLSSKNADEPKRWIN